MKKKFSLDLRFLQVLFEVAYMAGAYGLIQSQNWTDSWRTANKVLLIIVLVAMVFTNIVCITFLHLSRGPYQRKLKAIDSLKAQEKKSPLWKQVLNLVFDVSFLIALYLSPEHDYFNTFTTLILVSVALMYSARIMMKKLITQLKGNQ